MWSPKKSIPRLAVAALPLVGVGCANDSAPTLTQGLEAFCLKLLDCYQLNYPVESCVQYYLQDFDVEQYSPTCLGAYATYFSCMGGLTCEDFVFADDGTASPAAEACFNAVIDTINDTCPPI